MARLTFILGVTSILFSAAARSYGGYELEIADTVQAGQSTTVTVNLADETEDYDDGDSYSGYRIYLATTPPGWGTGPACYLVNYTDIDVTQVQVTIPASVVPDQTIVSLSVSELADGFQYGDSFSYSNDFTLEGGTGEWSALELNGYSVSDPDATPCTALQCTRDCGNKYYTDGTVPDDVVESDSNYEDFYNCIASCPGVSMPSWDEVWGDDGDDGDDGYYTSSAAGEYTSTQATAKPTKAISSVSATSTTGLTSSTTTTSTASSTTSPASTTSITTSSASRLPLAVSAVIIWCVGLLLSL